MRAAFVALLLPLAGAAFAQAPLPTTESPGASAQPIEPQVARREVKLPRFPSRDIELGIFAGTYATQNFGSSAVAGLRLGYHITEDFFVSGAFGRTRVTDDAFRQVLPGGCVVASDIAEGMLAEGLRRAADEGVPDLLAAACDAEHLSFADARFDAALVGLGLFILPHPERAVAELHRVLRPGGRLAVSVWGPRNDVPLIAHALDCIARHLPAPKVPRPSVFRLGDAAVLHDLLDDAGFRAIAVTPHRLACRFDSADAYWQAFLDLAGGAAEALLRLPDATQATLRAAVADDLAPHRDGSGFTLESTVLIATARR
ncbi:MAG TPA: class I SAM-dependent methyltransferase [Rhodocyclaceae bacterium]|nr:class I SAM-dependent methyltransferase [Rhodocyclaceae bacterium]